MTEQEFAQRVEAMAHRLEVLPPRVKISPPRGRDLLRIFISGWTVRATTKALAELTDAEIEFGIAQAYTARFRTAGLKPIYVAAPFLCLTLIGLSILIFGQNRFVGQFWLGFWILFGLMVFGYIAGMFVSLRMDDDARREMIAQALTLTGNASAAETYLIRSRTDHLLTTIRRMPAAERDRLDMQLEALRHAAKNLGLTYSSVGYFD